MKFNLPVALAFLPAVLGACGGTREIPSPGVPQLQPPPNSSPTPQAGGSPNPLATGQVTLAWDPGVAPSPDPSASPIPTVQGYKLYFGPASGNYTTYIDVGDVTQYTVTQLLAGTYYFACTAYSDGGESPYSNEVNTGITFSSQLKEQLGEFKVEIK